MLSVEYIAGFIDGEGSFMLLRDKNNRTYRPRCIISNTDIDVLRAIKYTFRLWDIKCNIHIQYSASVRYKQCYVLQVVERTSLYNLCLILQPHLTIKQRRAEIIMRYIELRRDEGIRGRVHEREEQELFDELKQLNKRWRDG